MKHLMYMYMSLYIPIYTLSHDIISGMDVVGIFRRAPATATVHAIKDQFNLGNCLPTCLPACLSVCLSIHVCLSVSLSVYTCIPVCLSVCLSLEEKLFSITEQPINFACWLGFLAQSVERQYIKLRVEQESIFSSTFFPSLK